MSEQSNFDAKKTEAQDVKKDESSENVIQERPAEDKVEVKKRKRRFLPSRESVKRFFWFLLAILLVGYIGLHVWTRMWFNRQLTKKDPAWITEEAYEYALEYWNQTICFPEEWKKEFPASHAISGDLDYLAKEWERRNQQENLSADLNKWENIFNQRNRVPSKEDWSSLAVFLAKLDPFLRDLRPMISILDHELQRVDPAGPLTRFFENYYFINNLQHAIRLKALVLSHEKKYVDAIGLLLSSLPLYGIDPLPKYSEYLWKNYLLTESIVEIQENMSGVWDKASLESWLLTLNRWAPYLFRLKKEYAEYYNLFSALTNAKIPIQFGVGVSAKAYIVLLKDQQFPPLGFAKAYSKTMDALMLYGLFGRWPEQDWRQPFEIELIRPLILTGDIENFYMLNTFSPDARWSWDRELKAANQYDQLRLLAAAKLYYLETKKFPATGADLVPAYFPSEIRNRKTGEAYQWDNSGNLIESNNKNK
jgi:hypothetical protein